jgi:hypothetical protein
MEEESGHQSSSKKTKFKTLRINIDLVQESYEDNPKYGGVTNLLTNKEPANRFPISRDTIFTPCPPRVNTVKNSTSKNQ